MLADLPGLIEGAHEGVGLGDRFLGHTERCRVLLHLSTARARIAGEAYKIVRGELEAYGHGLADKPEIVALSKSDAPDAGSHQDADRESEEGLQEENRHVLSAPGLGWSGVPYGRQLRCSSLGSRTIDKAP